MAPSWEAGMTKALGRNKPLGVYSGTTSALYFCPRLPTDPSSGGLRRLAQAGSPPCASLWKGRGNYLVAALVGAPKLALSSMGVTFSF